MALYLTKYIENEPSALMPCAFHRLALLAGLLLFAAPAVRTLAAEPMVRITTTGKTLAFSAEEFAALPHTDLTVADPHTQAPRKFSGVAVRELLVRAGAPLGDKLRGTALQLAVVFRAKDNYGVVFALADFDEAFSSRTLLLADAEDDKPLPEKSAPLQLVAPGDKKAARWARQVVAIEIVSLLPKP